MNGKCLTHKALDPEGSSDSRLRDNDVKVWGLTTMKNDRPQSVVCLSADLNALSMRAFVPDGDFHKNGRAIQLDRVSFESRYQPATVKWILRQAHSAAKYR